MEYEKDAASIFKKAGQIKSFAVQTVKTPLSKSQIGEKKNEYSQLYKQKGRDPLSIYI